MAVWTTLANNVRIKDYEVGVTLADKCKYIRSVGELTQADLAKVLGCAPSEIHYIEGGYIPENRNKITVINKLYRLWYELEEEREENTEE